MTEHRDDPAGGQPLAALEIELETSPVPEHQRVAGSPSAGGRSVRTFGDVEVGVWEMTPGGASDIEADEVFVVLAGAGSVRFEDGRDVSLSPGVVMTLARGERTVWTITRTLRKLYVSHTGGAPRE